jgi:hypothetical protein
MFPFPSVALPFLLFHVRVLVPLPILFRFSFVARLLFLCLFHRAGGEDVRVWTVVCAIRLIRCLNEADPTARRRNRVVEGAVRLLQKEYGDLEQIS